MGIVEEPKKNRGQWCNAPFLVEYARRLGQRRRINDARSIFWDT